MLNIALVCVFRKVHPDKQINAIKNTEQNNITAFGRDFEKNLNFLYNN